ncbi:MAG: tetratricopeptide repeat protein [Deltaproteobacteria bacterium]|nr:tetratricopeptide repeat protein [Deltaproteobacteria bacterium]
MRVVCERCNAQYTIDDKRVPASGLKIKCPKCMHTFEVKRGQEFSTPPLPPSPSQVETATFSPPVPSGGRTEPAGDAADAAKAVSRAGPPPGPADLDLDLDLDLPSPESLGGKSIPKNKDQAQVPPNINDFDLDMPPSAQASTPGGDSLPQEGGQGVALNTGDVEPGAGEPPSFPGKPNDTEGVNQAFADVFDEAMGKSGELLRPDIEPGGSQQGQQETALPDQSKSTQKSGDVNLFDNQDAGVDFDDFLSDMDAGMEVIDYDKDQGQETHYWIRRDGDKIFGPYSADAVKRMIMEQKLKGNEEVSVDEVNWVPLGSDSEFAPVLLEMVRKGAGEVLKEKESGKEKKKKDRKKKKKKVVSAKRKSILGKVIAACIALLVVSGVLYVVLFTDLIKIGGSNQNQLEFEKQLKSAHADITSRTADSIESAIRRLENLKGKVDEDLALKAKSLELMALAEKMLAGIDVKKSTKAAKKIFDDLTSAEPNFPLFFKAQGLYLGALGKYQDSRQAFEMAISRNDKDIEAYTLKARLFLRAGDKERASEALANAYKMAPKHPEILSLMGDLARLNGKPKDALKRYHDALLNDPNHIPSLLGIGEIYYEQGHYEDALKILERITGPLKRKALTLTLAKALDLAGTIYTRDRQYEKAVTALKEAVKLVKDNINYHLDYGEILLKTNQSKTAADQFKKAEVMDPKNVTATIGVARSLLQAGDAVQANLKLNDAKSFADNNAKLHYWLGKTSEALVQDDKAILSYKRAIELDPHYLDPYVALARLYLKREEGQQARDTLENVKSFAKNSPEAYNSFGEVYAWEKNNDKAEMSFRKALSIDPDFMDARLNLANVLRDTNRFEEAEKEYREVFARDSRSGVAHYHFGISLQLQKNYSGAINEYKLALKLGFKNTQSLAALGSAYYLKGDLAEAEKILLSALDLDSKNVKAHFFLGRVYLDHKDMDKAIYHFREALAWDPKDCNAHFWLGVSWERKDSPRDAIDHFEEAIRLCPSKIEAYLHLGSVFRSENAISQAIKNYRYALRIDPSRADILVQIGHSYEMLDDLKSAVKFYKKALKLHPEECSAWKSMAKVFVTSEKAKDAIKAFSKAITYCPDDAEPYRFLGYLYKDMNKLKKAKMLFEKYIKLAPNAEDLGQIKDEIEYLKQDIK